MIFKNFLIFFKPFPPKTPNFNFNGIIAHQFGSTSVKKGDIVPY